jgi:NAD(P)-dependent dehydrogenase (short-subunit alcohol dehydrogenase family)
MSGNLSGKVIAITGGGSGIGAETARALAARGAKLSLADLSKTGLEAVQSSIKEKFPDVKVMITPLDVCSTEAVDKWIADTVSQLGKLDGGVNLAGIIGKGIGTKGVEDLDDAEWDSIINVNLSGTFKTVRAQLKAMNDGGSVVTTASVAGVKGFAFNSAYTASKHGVVGLTRSAAKEVGKRGIRVNCVCP